MFWHLRRKTLERFKATDGALCAAVQNVQVTVEGFLTSLFKKCADKMKKLCEEFLKQALQS